MRIETLDTPCLGNRSYVFIDGGEAIVVDPPRDIDRVESLADMAGATSIALVLETHRHADYLSGGLELSRRHRATYVVPSGEPDPRFPFVAAREGDRHGVSGVGVRVIATPGHTPHHVAYAIDDDGQTRAVCTGGGLLHGTVGRTDLYGDERTVSLAHDQWRSARRLFDELPRDTLVLPTHGFGSLCSAGGVSIDGDVTLADERDHNPALCLAERIFVAGLVENFGPIPRHYSRLPLLNAAGPGPVDHSPAPVLDPVQLRRRQAAGHWLVDVRPRREFARAHLLGSVNVEASGPLVAYLPWILPAGAGVVLLGDTHDVAYAARQLTQVGIDRPLGIALGSPADWAGGRPEAVRSYSVSDFGGLIEATARGDAVALDVRTGQEWTAGHVRHALHLALPDLAEIADPTIVRSPIAVSGEVWVYCGGGFRAAIAASLLDASGARVTLIDQPFAAAEQMGLTVSDTTRTYDELRPRAR